MVSWRSTISLCLLCILKFNVIRDSDKCTVYRYVHIESEHRDSRSSINEITRYISNIHTHTHTLGIFLQTYIPLHPPSLPPSHTLISYTPPLTPHPSLAHTHPSPYTLPPPPTHTHPSHTRAHHSREHGLCLDSRVVRTEPLILLHLLLHGEHLTL